MSNKSDLKDERVVTDEEIEEKRIRLGIDFFETSATKKINIEESMNNMIQKIYKSVYYGDENTTHGITIEKKGISKSQSVSKCCKN